MDIKTFEEVKHCDFFYKSHIFCGKKNLFIKLS